MSSTIKYPSWLYPLLKDNPDVQSLTACLGPLPQSSLMQEALVIATSYLNKPRPMLVIKQNLYNAQQFYERVSTLLDDTCCALCQRG